jgi:hypothetical protein
MATGFQIAPEEDGTRFFRFSKEFCDFAKTRRAALKITSEESRDYLIRHDLADPGDFQGGVAHAEAGNELE